jgi:hypothetical protein
VVHARRTCAEKNEGRAEEISVQMTGEVTGLLGEEAPEAGMRTVDPAVDAPRTPANRGDAGPPQIGATTDERISNRIVGISSGPGATGGSPCGAIDDQPTTAETAAGMVVLFDRSFVESEATRGATRVVAGAADAWGTAAGCN